MDCHPRHLPESAETITAYVVCHEGQPHFQIGDCRHCHINAHKPLTQLRDPIKPTREECLSCHFEVGQAMARATSRHAELYCNRCHNHHKDIPGCLDCHNPHLDEQTATDCLRCHSAHQLLRVFAAGYLPVSYCKVCHAKQARDLADTNTNHGERIHPLLLVRSVTVCRTPRLFIAKHRLCLECHEDAHRLVSHP